MIQINHKEKIPLNVIFPDGAAGGEAHDWTPSLYNNEQGILDLLSNTLNIDIEPTDMEYYVWDKSRIDILGNNCATGNRIIIENQFGLADDSHFSRIMKYRAGINKMGYNVDTIIWIVEDADDAIIEVLRDLNNHYSETNFYLVKMFAEKDFSNNATYVDYEIIVKPNAFIKENENLQSLSDDERNIIKFWNFLSEHLSTEVKREFPTLSRMSTGKKFNKWFRPKWHNKDTGMELKILKNIICIDYQCGEQYSNLYNSLQAKSLPFVFVDTVKYKYNVIRLQSNDNEFDINNEDQWLDIANWFDQSLKTFIQYKQIIIDEFKKIYP